MKKISSILAAFSLIATGTALATVETTTKAPTTGYTSGSSKPPVNGLSAAPKDLAYYQTDITVVNGSNDYIHSMVVDTSGYPVYDKFIPAEVKNDHIQHASWRGLTHVAFQNAYGSPIFDRYVCRLAIVSLFGGPHYYRWTIDESLCDRP